MTDTKAAEGAAPDSPPSQPGLEEITGDAGPSEADSGGDAAHAEPTTEADVGTGETGPANDVEPAGADAAEDAADVADADAGDAAEAEAEPDADDEAEPDADTVEKEDATLEVAAAPATDEDASEAAVAKDGAEDGADAEDASEDDRVPFAEFGLPPELMRAIADLGFSHCTPIQAETLPHSLSNYDVTGQAQTGTGKTAAFLISIISHQLEEPLPERPDNGTPRALIIAPTRELALQIAEDARGLTSHLPWMNVVSVVGGMDFERQRQILEN